MIHEALKYIRLFHRLKQNELAERLEVSRSFLSEIESGKKNPTLELLEKYADEFKISVSSIMFFEEKLENDSLAEKMRVKSAKLVIKIFKWISA